MIEKLAKIIEIAKKERNRIKSLGFDEKILDKSVKSIILICDDLLAFNGREHKGGDNGRRSKRRSK